MIRTPYRKASPLLLALCLLAPISASQAEPKAPESKDSPAQPARPVTDTNPTAGEVATTPLRALNLTKHKVPPVLENALANPYALTGRRGCLKLAAEIKELNGVLGDDFDDAHVDAKVFTPGYVAQSVVDSFIPFGGIISEISGANSEKRKMQAAVYAGVARRSFLKGIGLSRGCRAPARPM